MVTWSRVWRRHALVALACFGTTLPGEVALARCESLLPTGRSNDTRPRAVTARDLVELRDIGQPDASVWGQSPLAVSPDGQQLAFVITRSDATQNLVCRGLAVLSLNNGRVRTLDVGGEQMLAAGSVRGYFDPSGAPAVVRPVWSPDGMRIAFLRRDHGVTQAWRATLDGSRAAPLTHSAVDIDAIAWSTDGRRLIFASRPGEAKAQGEITHEGDKGWLYDARVVPNITARPLLSADLPREVDAVSLVDGTQSLASPADAAALASTSASDNALDPAATALDGASAWAKPTSVAPRAPLDLEVRDAAQQFIACPWDFCRGRIVGLWWRGSSQNLWFLRREGWNDGSMGLYRWRLGQGEPQRILSADEVLTGCVMAPAGLICGAESARLPRRLVRIDPESGRQNLLFDPNPEFARLELGRVQRLTWRNTYGLPAWGDLVLPPHTKLGARLPLIVVQYHSDGFLRGGTGDEYPIFLYAAQGFAVLSLERPPFYAETLAHIATWDEFNSANQAGWAERWSLLSSLKAGIEKAVATGFVDRARMGITGLSDGATTARFALINYPVFAAAAISTCCVEPRTAMTDGGIAWADWQHTALHYPRASDDRPDFWRPVSVVLNASRMDTPLLMQPADSEYQLSLEAFTALREAGKPVEMYVFPDEFHVKVEPEHRLSSYLRSLDWFAFWLQGREDPDPAKADQYRRWEAMRAGRASHTGHP